MSFSDGLLLYFTIGFIGFMMNLFVKDWDGKYMNLFILCLFWPITISIMGYFVYRDMLQEK